MTRGNANTHWELVLDRMFAEAERDKRPLGAEELMRAIGLKRTSINSTFSHVNERRKRHNEALAEADRVDRSDERVETQQAALRIANAQLRQDLKAERIRSEQYAKVIRQLALENHQLKHADGVVTDARGRFADV